MFLQHGHRLNFCLLMITILTMLAFGTVVGCDSNMGRVTTTADLEQTLLPIPATTLEVRPSPTVGIMDVTPTLLLPPVPTLEMIDFRKSFPTAAPGFGELANHLLFYSNRSGSYELFQINLDGSDPVQLTHNSAYDLEPAWSTNGKIAFTSTSANGSWEVFLIVPESRLPIQLTDFGADSWSLAWSPDSETLAFVSDVTGDDEIYLVNLDGEEPVNLSQYPDANDFLPVWSPSGGQIAFVSDRAGAESDLPQMEQDIYTFAPDGSGLTQLTFAEGRDTSPNWSPDGGKIAFVSERDGNFEVYLMNADGADSARLTNSAGYEWSPTWSPDGTLIVFTSTRDHRETYDLYMMAPDGSNQTRLTFDPANDIIPRWWP